MQNPTLIIIGCFDTKGEDFEYLYACLKERGFDLMTLNIGVLGSTDRFPVDIVAEAVAEAGGAKLSDLQAKSDRGHALEIMGRGAAKLLERSIDNKNIAGVIGMGGGGGTYMILAAMQSVPFGIPKLCLTTLATKDLSDKVGTKDIVLMPSIVDVAGLNPISRTLIRQAAGALVGMADSVGQGQTTAKGNIAISVFGNTQICADRCSELLKEEGYEVMAFHAVGSGGRTMESLVREGLFDAVVDLTVTELADELCGGICSAGPDRLTAAANQGIPQLVVPGCLDMVNFGGMDSVPQKYAGRQLYSWAPDVTLMRTDKSENRILGKEIAYKLNGAKAPVTILLPLGGLSKIGGKGQDFYDPETDRELFNTLRSCVKDKVHIEEVDANINTRGFAERAVTLFLEMMQEHASV